MKLEKNTTRMASPKMNASTIGMDKTHNEHQNKLRHAWLDVILVID
jgi:hypothetical protein